MREMKDSGIEWIGEIPIDWKILRIKELFAEVNERAVDNSLQLLSVSEYYGVAPKSEKIEEGDFLTHAESLDGYKICKPDDIVMNIMLAWKRALGVSRYDGIISPAYCVFRKRNEDVWPYYFHYLFRTQRYANLFKQYSTGIIDSRLRLYPDKFLALKCQVPPVKEQKRMVKYLDAKCSLIDSIIVKQEQIIEKLKEYKLSIITEAITKGLDLAVEMKDSGNEWLRMIPEKSMVTRCGHLFSIILGKMLTNEKRAEDDTYEKYFCAANVHFDGIDEKDLKRMWFSVNERKQYEIKRGDLLVVEGGAGAGGAAIAEVDYPGIYIQNSIMIARSENEALNRWLYYTLFSLVKRNYVDFVCNKATIPHFTKEKLGNVPVVLFSMPTIEQITEFLDRKCAEIDNNIMHRQNAVDKLREYKRPLIYEVVTGKKEV